MSEILNITPRARVVFNGESLESGHITRAYLDIGNQEGSFSVRYDAPVAMEAGLDERAVNAFTARVLGATSIQAAEFTGQSDRNSKRDVGLVLEALHSPNLVAGAHDALSSQLLVVEKKVSIPQRLGRLEKATFELLTQSEELEELAQLRNISIFTVRNQLKVIRRKLGGQSKAVTTVVAGHLTDELDANTLRNTLPTAS